MNSIALLLSSLITQLVYVWSKPTVVVVTETVYEKVTKKDPHGLIRNDLHFLQSCLPRLGYKTGDSVESVAYRQGGHDFFNNIIVAKMVAKR